MRKIWEVLNYETKLHESLYITKDLLSKEVGVKNIGKFNYETKLCESFFYYYQNFPYKREGAKTMTGIKL